MESHENTHSQIMEYIKKNPDLQKAIELLRREGKVSRTALQFEFHWTEWKARKVYEELRFICRKGLAFKEDESHETICRAYHGYVELITVGRGFDSDMEIDEDLSQESEEEGFDEDEEEIDETEEDEEETESS
ncbi:MULTISPECIES: hypothetical protein [unclassified Stygiolobus]|uniref:hypothetical protein n=1 Tax=unclassified Stygiolobus TaxID=2824672 RepID=UPI00307EFDEF